MHLPLLLNNGQNDEECDATDDDSSNEDGNINTITDLFDLNGFHG